ncbi:MAG: hypothetical protein JSV94_02705 [Methanobacteriota archaeon]|nr:MAG: hypothetical protein JSV94_02705 [Euryarchaeota archaeon]
MDIHTTRQWECYNQLMIAIMNVVAEFIETIAASGLYIILGRKTPLCPIRSVQMRACGDLAAQNRKVHLGGDNAFKTAPESLFSPGK